MNWNWPEFWNGRVLSERAGSPFLTEVTGTLELQWRSSLGARPRHARRSVVGVFAHGDNARELETMVNFGMQIVDALRSATSVNARVLYMDNRLGQVKSGLLADPITVDGDPLRDITSLRKVKFVIKGGVIYKTLQRTIFDTGSP